MISLALFRRNLYSLCKPLLIFAAVLAMYTAVVIYMFDPELAKVLSEYQQMMPEVMAAFGMSGGGESLIAFLHTYLYGFFMLIFPMVFSIIMVNILLARYVDQGSLACMLATPNSRGKIIATQLISAWVGLFLLIALMSAVGIAVSAALFPGALDLRQYLSLNASTFLFHFMIMSICFLAACIFHDSRGYFTLGAGLPLLFYVLEMMANLGGQLEKLQYATLFTLFPGEKIIAQDSGVWQANLLLFAIGAVLYLVGALYFTRRDFSI